MGGSDPQQASSITLKRSIAGKGENIWDRLTHTNPKAVKNEDNGDIACDSYHKYKEDVQILKDIGVSILIFMLNLFLLAKCFDIRCSNQPGVATSLI